MLAKIENIGIEKISACITHPMSLISCRQWVVCSALVLGGGLLQMCLCGRAGLSGVLSRASLLACCDELWCGVLWYGPMRGSWWALQKRNRLFQMAVLWWSAQLPQTLSSYSISPTQPHCHYLISASLLCHPWPTRRLWILSLTFFACQTHHSVFSSSFF